jgi:hypothetical protein
LISRCWASFTYKDVYGLWPWLSMTYSSDTNPTRVTNINIKRGVYIYIRMYRHIYIYTQLLSIVSTPKVWYRSLPKVWQPMFLGSSKNSNLSVQPGMIPTKLGDFLGSRAVLFCFYIPALWFAYGYRYYKNR